MGFREVKKNTKVRNLASYLLDVPLHNLGGNHRLNPRDNLEQSHRHSPRGSLVNSPRDSQVDSRQKSLKVVRQVALLVSLPGSQLPNRPALRLALV